MTAQHTPTDAALLDMSGVTLSYLNRAGEPLASDVDWRVEPGDFWVIGGLHGSGKSDFLLAACGVMPVHDGRYQLMGQTVTTENMDILSSKVGLVFDGGQLISNLSLADNIALPIRYRRNCRYEDCDERVDALMRYTGVTRRAHRLPGEVGRGWCQRAGLARALAMDPEVLLLDNPLSGQDPVHVRWWLDRLVELASGHEIQDGRTLTLVVTTINLRYWVGVANRFAILKNKRLVTMTGDTASRDAVEALQQELLGTSEGED